jgi:hypothetical protein
MKLKILGRCLLVVLVSAMGAIACVNRGTLPATCSNDPQMAVPADAAAAVYFDLKGAVVGTRAEDLKGTARKNMCPTPDEGPGPCSPSPPWCIRQYGTPPRNVCMPC